ncbi:hypothetical protein [Microbacterium abyssi]|uniref:hypothetical protein n=1 Tax=Microbacterium abyssi TaxID=2782166 RepID=UPI001888CC60|nr:hypothetical protein [Microbacterium sp. A18JL241]
MGGPFDPGRYRDPQLLAGGARGAVEDVLLQASEERFRGRVLLAGTDSARAPDHAVTGQLAEILSASELRSFLAVDDASGDVTAHRGGVFVRPYTDRLCAGVVRRG